MNNRYYLKYYNENILSFRFLTSGLEKGNVEILEISMEYENYLPHGLELTNDGLLSWLKRRSVPKNREFIKELLKSMGLNERDTRGIIDVSKGLSLNDVYWIEKQGENLRFENINLYENDFSEALALVAFTGYDTKIAGLWSSPELTTTGTLPKCWRKKDDNIFLYKGGTKGFANAGNEPYSEFYAAQIAKRLGYNHVPYELEQWKGILASVCPIFTSKERSYIPIGYIVPTGGIAAVEKYIRNLGNEDIYRDFQRMILFDALIFNKDRHYGNFGLIYDNRTMEVVGLNPIFDNGVGLFAYALDSETETFENLKEYASNQNISYYGLPYDDLVREICTRDMISDMNKLINFKFQRHERYNLSEIRLKTIEKFINERARELSLILENCTLEKDFFNAYENDLEI